MDITPYHLTLSLLQPHPVPLLQLSFSEYILLWAGEGTFLLTYAPSHGSTTQIS